MKVLVATWGNPKNWGNGKYNINGKELISKTTYIPLFEVEKPDKGIIIVQNSLFPEFNVWDESSLKEKIKEKLREFGANEEILNKTEVIVTISSGIYKNHKFMANFYDILLNLFIQLYFQLKDAKEVVLDLTHGINYLPTITLLTLSYLKKILGFKLKIYNATPVLKENPESYFLNLGYIDLEGKIKLNVKELEETHKEIKRVFKEKINFNAIHAFKLLVAYLYGLIFPLVKNSNFDFDENILLELMPKQEKENEEYKVKGKINSEKLFKYIFAILFAKNIAEKFRYNKIDLEVIKKIKDEIPNPVAKKLIENEIKILEKVYEYKNIIFSISEEIRYKECKDLADLIEKVKNKGKRKTSVQYSDILRNYFAHVSFLYDLIYLSKEGIKSEEINYVKEIKEIEL